MRTTQDCLLVKLKVFETDWACFVLYSILNSFEEIGFNVLPFSLAKWLRRFINKPKTFSKAKFVNVLHPFFLDIIISTLFTFLSLSKHWFYIWWLLNISPTASWWCPLGWSFLDVANRAHYLHTSTLQAGLSGTDPMLWWFFKSLVFKWIEVVNFKLFHQVVLHGSGIDGFFLNINFALSNFIQHNFWLLLGFDNLMRLSHLELLLFDLKLFLLNLLGLINLFSILCRGVGAKTKTWGLAIVLWELSLSRINPSLKPTIS